MAADTALPILAEIYNLSMAGRYVRAIVILTIVLDLLVVLDRLFNRCCQHMRNRYGQQRCGCLIEDDAVAALRTMVSVVIKQSWFAAWTFAIKSARMDRLAFEVRASKFSVTLIARLKLGKKKSTRITWVSQRRLHLGVNILCPSSLSPEAQYMLQLSPIAKTERCVPRCKQI